MHGYPCHAPFGQVQICSRQICHSPKSKADKSMPTVNHAFLIILFIVNSAVKPMQLNQ